MEESSQVESRARCTLNQELDEKQVVQILRLILRLKNVEMEETLVCKLSIGSKSEINVGVGEDAY